METKTNRTRTNILLPIKREKMKKSPIYVDEKIQGINPEWSPEIDLLPKIFLPILIVIFGVILVIAFWSCI